MSRANGSNQKLESVDDLTELSSISDDILVSCLRERFLADKIYTSVGSSGIVAVNPHKYVSSNADSVMLKYAAEYRDTTGERERMPPHVFQLANDAYYNMRRTTQDQVIIMSGETGSGKSESRRLAIKSILELSVSNPGKKGSKLATQIPGAEFVLESFGNARTLFNANASRFGKYTELQFNDRGRLSGVKTLDYYLEKGRVVGAPSGERNFHIFYYLVAGATPDERQHLHLNEKTTYRYLGQRAQTAPRLLAGRDDDALRFDQLKNAFKAAGFTKGKVAQTCQLVAAILHLGNLEFTTDRHRDQDAAVVRNTDVLDIVADFLGVHSSALEGALSYKTKLVKKELCTVFLDPEGAAENRDALAKTLYSLLFAWINEFVNQKLCRDDFSTFVGIFDLPGPQNLGASASRSNSLDQFCVNYANERLQSWLQRSIFERDKSEYNMEGISRFVPEIPYFDNSECVRLMSNKPGGLIHIMDDQSRRQPKKTDHTMIESFGKRWGNHSSFKVGAIDRSGFPTFTVSHYNGPITYSSEGFLERNADALNPDFVSLLRGAASEGVENTGSVNPFVRELFSDKAIATQAHPRNEETIVSAQQPNKPMRAPSTRRKQSVRRSAMATVQEAEDKEDDEALADVSSSGTPCVAGEFRLALETLFKTLDETVPWYVFCINPNDSQLPNQMEGRAVKGQVRSAGLSAIARRANVVFETQMPHDEFTNRYKEPLTALGVTEGSSTELIEQCRTALSLAEIDIVVGTGMVFLSRTAFHKLEDRLRATDTDEQKRNRLRDAEAEAGLEPRGNADYYAPYATPEPERSPSPGNVGMYGDPFAQSSQVLPLVSNASPFQRADLYNDYDDGRSLHTDFDDGRSRYTSHRDESESNFGTESYAPSRNMFQNTDKKALLDKDGGPADMHDGETVEEVRDSSARRRWTAVVWLLTFFVPGFLLSSLGRMKRPDIRQAWREKFAINMIIWFICACTVFVIAILGNIICPTEHVYQLSELASHGTTAKSPYVAIRGEVFDLNQIASVHSTIISVVPKKLVMNYAGVQADKLFPVQVSALCNGVDGSVHPFVTLGSANSTIEPNSQYHDFRISTSDPRPDWYFESMTQMRYQARVGFIGWTPKSLKNLAGTSRAAAVYNGMVYDVTDYGDLILQSQPGTVPPTTIPTDFMLPEIINIFKLNAGKDVTKLMDALNVNSDVMERQNVCLRNLFLIGKADHRNSPQCQFSTYILLAISIIMISVIGFKFLAAIHFGSARAPEDHDKFVILQVPCYTEGEESLRRTIDSMAKLRYDDKRKLLLVVCDGMIVGSGNDRPTPRIALDILGSDPNLDPEPLSFLSLGEGAKQHNMGKVYSGLYECAGHVVPYLVIVKVGKPTERQRPGNRGKRDSQMIVMHFLNKVHFNAPMNPFELEMYHQIKNVIGVNPSFYEYLLTVDADTTVEPLSLNRLVSAMTRDKKVLGVCGETSLANSKQSIITMMQVYEYFISHHLAKAFESLFGSVTCLPGCFSMFRLRTSDTHKPLFIANSVIQDYSENRVDTLHMKNLLHLGEDRYLTTLLLKHFSNYKTIFVRDAFAQTVAPDEWQVLLSQRRRWINSTVHNLAELVFLDRLCGFCCFSMRFVVFIDLLSTIVQPVTVAYIVYLVYLVVAKHLSVPTLSIVMIAAIYGLQALIFVFRRKWDMIGWMVFYILAVPAFSFFLPLYSFWKMDDFSWGSTRVVLGEKGKKMIVHDEGKFDPRSIPLKTWSDYENELWDKESNHSIGSWVPPQKFNDGGYPQSATASLYGRETYYDHAPQSHGFSPVPSQYGAPPGYNSGRNTPLGSMYAPSQPMSSTGLLPSMQPVGNYHDMPYPQSRSPEDVDFGPGAPTDADIERAVQQILRNADLTQITKREIRRQLEQVFAIDLTPRKSAVNAIIDRILLSQA